MSELLRDASALRMAWDRLLKEHHHLHGPQAAALLGVPEAAMIASRLGHGATELSLGIADLLTNSEAPLTSWGKVLLAIANPMGVALAIQQIEAVQRGEAGIRLEGQFLSATIHSEAVSNLYLFEQEDAHGHSVSLNWFDEKGQVMGRLFLMSKNGRDIALPYLLAHSRPAPSNDRFWLPLPGAQTGRAPALQTRRGSLKADGDQAAGLMKSAVLAIADTPGTHIHMRGTGGTLHYRGPLGKSFEAGGGVHATDSACKLHLQPGKATLAWRCAWTDTKGESLEGMSFEDPSGGSLDILAPTPNAVRLRNLS